jgi:hypothetical protein
MPTGNRYEFRNARRFINTTDSLNADEYSNSSYSHEHSIDRVPTASPLHIDTGRTHKKTPSNANSQTHAANDPMIVPDSAHTEYLDEGSPSKKSQRTRIKSHERETINLVSNFSGARFVPVVK